MSQYLELLDWRRLVALLYAEVRSRPHSQQTADWFRDQRNRLFRDHPQSPIPANARSGFRSLSYWDWDPLGRVEAEFRPIEIADSEPSRTAEANGEARLTPIGTVSFQLSDVACELQVLWLDAYGGGLFIPFRDSTCGVETYGGGRYLVDSVKGADLGSSYQSSTITLDFNYAYHPSCAYDPVWPCPLAPPENRLEIPVRLGERLAATEAS
jgi:uncharacterized protein (DUF1684 family)